jgi:hypothetical protein
LSYLFTAAWHGLAPRYLADFSSRKWIGKLNPEVEYALDEIGFEW